MKFKITREIIIEAPSLEDAKEMISDGWRIEEVKDEEA